MLAPNYLLKYKTETLPFVLRCSFIVVWIWWFMSKQEIHSRTHLHSHTTNNIHKTHEFQRKNENNYDGFQYSMNLYSFCVATTAFMVYYLPRFFRFCDHSKHFSFQFIYTINKKWKKKKMDEEEKSNEWLKNEWMNHPANEQMNERTNERTNGMNERCLDGGRQIVHRERKMNIE